MFGKSVSLEACGLCCLIIHSFLWQLRHLLGKHSNCGAGAYLLQNLWDPSSLAWDRTHIPALQAGLSTTGPKGESLPHVLLWRLKKIAHLTAQSGVNSSNSINVWVSSFAFFFFFLRNLHLIYFLKITPAALWRPYINGMNGNEVSSGGYCNCTNER